MPNAMTAARTDAIAGQSERHMKTVSNYLAEQFRTVENPSFETFKSFAHDYVNICLVSKGNDASTSLLSVSDQAELAHALRIDLPADTAAEAKSFDDFVTQLYALY